MMKKPKNYLELNINKVNQQSSLLYSINSIYSNNPSSTKSKKSKIDYDSLLAATKKTTSNNNKVSLHKISKFSNQVSTPQSISSYNTNNNKSNRNKNQTKTSNLIITKALSHSQFTLNPPCSNQRKSVLTSHLILPNDQQQEKEEVKETEKEKDKIKSLRKSVLSNQKQISLTEKQLMISNNDIGNDNFLFERNTNDNNLNTKKKNNKVKISGERESIVNFIVKQDLTHKKQAKSDYLSSQIRLSINNYLKSKSKQTTPKNMTKYSSSSKEIECLIDISNRKLKACSRLNNCIVNSKEKKDNKDKIIKERIKTNKQIKEIFRKTNQINTKNKVKIDKKLKTPTNFKSNLDVISTIKSIKSLNLIKNVVNDIDKDMKSDIKDINVTYSSKVSILNILEDRKEEEISSKSNSSSCLLDKFNNLKRETFVGSIKNKKKNMKRRNLIQDKEIIYDYIGEEVNENDNENENFSISDLFIKENTNKNESSNILFPYSTFFKYISNSIKDISIYVNSNSQDEKDNSKNILDSHTHTQNNDNNAYLCKNLKYITDPEYDLLFFYKSSDKILSSLESDYQKSFLSKEILKDKEKSFMMSSINEEIKNILNYQSSSLSERRLNKSATVTSFKSYNKLDNTRNQYEDDENEYKNHIEIKNLKYKSSNDVGTLHYMNNKNIETRRILTEINDKKEENNDVQRKNCNIY